MTAFASSTVLQPAPAGQAAAAPLALTPAQRAVVRAIVRCVVPAAQVWVFGSRATGRARPFSDLDLLVEHATPLTLAERAALEDAFDASELPFRVDLVEGHALVPGMRERVMAERRAL